MTEGRRGREGFSYALLPDGEVGVSGPAATMREGREVEVVSKRGSRAVETLGPRVEGAGGPRFAVHRLARATRHRIPESLGLDPREGPRLVRRDGRTLVIGHERALRQGEGILVPDGRGGARRVEVGRSVDRDDDGTALHEIEEPLPPGPPEREGRPGGREDPDGPEGQPPRRHPPEHAAECRFAKVRGRWLVTGPEHLLEEGRAALVQRRSGVVETVAVGAFVERRPRGWAVHEFTRSPGRSG